MRNQWRPLIVVVVNFVIGALVSQGFIDSSQQNEVADLIAEIVGYGIILITSVFTLVHTFKRQKGAAQQPQAVEQTVKTEVHTTPVFTQQPPMEADLPSGTPPVSNE